MGVRAGIMIPSNQSCRSYSIACMHNEVNNQVLSLRQSVVGQVKNFEISTFTKIASSSQDIDAFHVSNALIELCAE